MERYRRIGVFLTGSPADSVAIAFAGQFAELAQSEKLLCVHVPGSRLEGFEDHADVPVDVDQLREDILAQLPQAVADHADIEVRAGDGVVEILRAACDLELDLIVKGRLLPTHQAAAGSAFTRLARKSPCSVLVVPNYCRPHMSRLLVTVDFSEHSRLALEAALEIARAAAARGERAQVLVHNVYCVGYGYHKLGLSFQQAVAQRGKLAQEKLDKFVSQFDTSGIEFDTVCTCSDDVTSAVLSLSAARKMDMIVVGSRGMSTAAAVVLGGTAERILANSAQPLLIVKQKGETIGLLNALLGG